MCVWRGEHIYTHKDKYNTHIIFFLLYGVYKRLYNNCIKKKKKKNV